MNFVMRNGVAVPTDLDTLGVFQGLQRTLRVAADGNLGPATLAAALYMTGQMMREDTCYITAPLNVQELANEARRYARAFACTYDGSPDFTPRPAPAQQHLPAATRSSMLPVIAGAAIIGLLIWRR